MNIQEARERLLKRVLTCTLPETQIEVKYNKPDLVQSAVQNNLPTRMSNQILDSMKSSLKGKQAKSDADDPDYTDAEVTDLVVKARLLLKSLAVEPKFGDADTEDMMDVKLIPATDALAFLQEAILSVRVADTVTGDEVTADSLTTFPERKRGK